MIKVTRKEEYFEGVPISKIKDQPKPIYYKDLVRQEETNGLKAKKPVGETPAQEQERLKREFLEAAQTTVEDDNDDLFKIKEKTQQEIEDENEEFRKFLEKESKVKKPEEVDILKRFWGDESKLDENERFLRRYILTKG